MQRHQSLIFFLLAILLSWNGTAQTAQIDSLKKLAEVSTGEKKVDILNECAFSLSSYNYAQSKEVASKAYQLAADMHYYKGMAQATIHNGLIELSIGHDSLARIQLRWSIALCEKSNEEKLKGSALTYMGLSHQVVDQLDSADFFYKQAYQLLKDSANPLYLSFLYLNLGKQQELRNNPVLQIFYLNKSWEIRKRLADKRPLVYLGRDLVVYYTERGDYKKSASILHEIQTALGKDTVDSEEINIIYKERAIISADQGDYKTALRLFNQVKKFYERNESQLELVNLFTDMGHVLSFSSSNYETSLKYYFKAIRLAEANRFQREATLLYARVGWVYYLMEQDELSEKFSLKALTNAQSRYAYEEGSALNMLGLLATRNHQEKKALDFFNHSKNIREKNNFRAALASTLLNIGILFEQLGDYKKAESYDLQSLQVVEELNNASDLCYSYQGLGQLYTKMKVYDKALTYLNKAEALSKKINAKDVLRDVYKNKRDLFKSKSNYIEAFRYSLAYEAIHDSLFNQNLSNRISAMQYDFELDQKENEIKILNQQQQIQKSKLDLQQAEIKRQSYIIAVGIFIFLNAFVAIFVVLRFYRKVKKLNREISEQNEEIMTQSEELKEANEILSKLNKEINEQKEEIQAQAEELTESNEQISKVNLSLEEKVKARTAELKEAYTELDTFFYRSSHDFRRPLTTFMGLAEVSKITVKDQAALELFEKVNETARNLDKMLLKLQSVSAVGSQELIYSEVLLDQIVQLELDNFREQISQKSIRIITDIKLTRPLYSYPVLIKFIIENLLENAISFGKTTAPWIRISIRETDEEVLLEISDNGQGIEPDYLPRVFDMYFRASERSKGNGLGLYIVKKMVDKLGGRIELKSEYEIGTSVSVYLRSYSKL